MTKSPDLFSSLQELFSSGRSDEARDLLQERVSSNETSDCDRAILFYLLGRIHYYTDNLAGARECFLSALACDSDHFYSRFYLARITEQFRDIGNATRLYADCLSVRKHFFQLGDFLTSTVRAQEYTDPDLQRVLAAKSIKPAGDRKQPPKVSVIVLCHNKLEHTQRCLDALLRHMSTSEVEIIVVDNASVDDTPAYLETLSRRITFLHSPANLGFVEGNNLAVRHAHGEFLMFLNNDTEVQKDWLTELLKCFVLHPGVGVVGSKLVYPNGKLQEAGGIIFRDGLGWNYGRGDHPHSYQYNFVREVDYCSGAALMVRRDLFLRLGSFDQRFAPAYYEDVDLCFGIRKLGYKVLYCPTSVVVHHEGATAGTDLKEGYKRHQSLNTPKFREKWETELQAQHPNDPGVVIQASDRRRGKRVLIIDELPPLPDRSAGSLRMHNIVKQMLHLGYRITYAHLVGKGLDQAAEQHLKELRLLGVEFIWLEHEKWGEFGKSPAAKPIIERIVQRLDLRKRGFDAVYVCFWWVASYFIDYIKTQLPEVPVLIDSVDLNYVREERRAKALNDASLKRKAKEIKAAELETYAKADAIITVSETERAELQRELGNKPVFVLSMVYEYQRGFDGAKRHDFLFIGNFNHTPNTDAVSYFVRDILPRIKQEIPECKFYIVGNNPTPEVASFSGEDVVVTGWVPDTRPYLERCRVFVAPLTYGAGIKGKIAEALASGIPVVTTPIGAEGMGIVPDEHALIAEQPEEFALQAVSLYKDQVLWNRMASNGKQLIAERYSAQAMRRHLEYIMALETRQSFESGQARVHGTRPRVSIIIVTYNQFVFTQQCLDSIRKFTPVNYEIIVVDNASVDGTPEKLSVYPDVRLMRNSENLGFPAAVNCGLKVALGEYVVLLNNDTVVTEGWLKRLIAVAESDPTIGIVGPLSNYVSGPQLDPCATYKDLDVMHEYALQLRRANDGVILPFPRVAFLCTLIQKHVIEKIGGLDERFSPGNFEDDDFCLRAQLAGFKTVIAKDVFIHHHGSKSFMANGKDQYHKRLDVNRRIFVEKWGADPDGIWLEGKLFRKRNPLIPLEKDRFIELFNRAKFLIEEKELSYALTCLRTALSVYHTAERRGLNLDFPDVLNLTGNIALVVGDLERARQFFEEELKLIPSSSRACLGAAQVFLAAELNDSAKVMFEWALENDPHNTQATNGLARCNQLLGLAQFHNSLVPSADFDS